MTKEQWMQWIVDIFHAEQMPQEHLGAALIKGYEIWDAAKSPKIRTTWGPLKVFLESRGLEFAKPAAETMADLEKEGLL